MGGSVLDFAAVDQLVDALKAAGLRNVDTDPDKLRLPGVLVQVTGVSQDRLDGPTITTRLLCISGDKNHRRALAALQQLYNEVLEVIDPDDDAVLQAVTLPSQSQTLPCLVIPFNLHD